MSNNRSIQIAKNTFFLYFRMLFLMFVTFFTSRVILESLGVVDYGIHNVVGGLASMFVFFRSSLANVTQRYLNIELGANNIERAHQIFCLHQTIYLIIAIIVIIAAETIGLWLVYNKLVIPPERMYAALWVYQFTIISLAITILSVVYDSVLIAHEDMKIYSYVGVVEGIMKLIISYIISIVMLDKLILYSFLLFVVALGIRLFYSFFCKRRYAECYFQFRWNTNEIKEASSLVSWNTIGTVVWAINDQGINILLNMFFGPAVNAARGISFQISNAINNFGTNFYTSVRPQMVKSYATKDFEYLYKLFFASSKYSVYLLWMFCLPVMLCIDQILALWLHDVPEYTNIFTIWILGYSMVNILNNPIWSLALAVGKLKSYILIGSSVFFTAFPLSYICLQANCPPVSVFVCMFLIRIVYIYIVINILRRYIPISLKRYFSEVIRPVIFVISVSGIIALSFSMQIEMSILNDILICIICWAAILGSVWFLGLRNSEKSKLITFIMNKIKM